MLRKWRVRRGIKFMDARIGRDVWLPRVIIGDIDTSDGENCALAQATGQMFWSATRRLGFSESYLGEYKLIMLGFMNLPGEPYGFLDAAWREEIMKLPRYVPVYV